MNPCPFCGDEHIVLYTSRDFDEKQHTLRHTYYCHCVECDASGPPAWTKQTARRKWNKRAEEKKT